MRSSDPLVHLWASMSISVRSTSSLRQRRSKDQLRLSKCWFHSSSLLSDIAFSTASSLLSSSSPLPSHYSSLPQTYNQCSRLLLKCMQRPGGTTSALGPSSSPIAHNVSDLGDVLIARSTDQLDPRALLQPNTHVNLQRLSLPELTQVGEAKQQRGRANVRHQR